MKKIIFAIISLIPFQLHASELNNEIQKSIFQYNFELNHDKFKEEIQKLNSDSEKNENAKIKNTNESLQFNLNQYKLTLQNLVKTSSSPRILAESHFRLALIEREENKKNLKEALSHVKIGLTYFSKMSSSSELEIKMNYYLSSLYFMDKNYKKSKQSYEKVLNLIQASQSGHLYDKEEIRSYIGLGDNDYFLSDFDSAFKNFKSAKNSLIRSSNLQQDTKQNLEMTINFRLVLSSYRNGDYQASLNGIKDLVYKRDLTNSSSTDSLFNSLKSIGAISLFEIKDSSLYSRISKDKIYGDFGKEMIFKSFPLYSELGDFKFINAVAESLKNEFYFSKFYPNFLKEWRDLNKNNENEDLFYELSYFACTEISKKSLWRSKYNLNETEDDNRKNILLQYSDKTGDYFYHEGTKNNSDTNFLKAAEIYHAQLEENVFNKNRGLVIEKEAESLYLGGDIQASYKVIESLFSYHLDKDLFKSGLFLRVKIARALSHDAKSTQEKNYKIYESAVDAFLSSFQEEKEARNSLYESAKRAEILSDFVNAKERYERLLVLLPQVQDNFKSENQAKTIQSLSVVLLNIKDATKQLVDDATQDENAAIQFQVEKKAQKSIQKTNAKLAKVVFDNLNNQGKIRESAEFLNLWSKNNLQNPNSPQAYLNSVQVFAELQSWKKVLQLSENYHIIYPNNEKENQAQFWAGKSSENLLLFAQAASYYEKSNKLEALEKAIEIYHILNKKQNEAEALEIKSQLMSINKKWTSNDIALNNIKYLDIYDELNLPLKFKIGLEKTLKLKKLNSNLKNEVELRSLMFQEKNKPEKILEVNKLFLAHLKNFKTETRLKFLYKVGLFLNKEEPVLFFKVTDNFKENHSQNSFRNMKQIVNNIENRLNYLEKFELDKTFLAETWDHFGILNQKIAENYEFVGLNFRLNLENKKAAQEYHVKAKQAFSKALLLCKNDIKLLKIKQDAKNYFPFNEKNQVQFILDDKSLLTGMGDYLSSTLSDSPSRVSQQESLK